MFRLSTAADGIDDLHSCSWCYVYYTLDTILRAITRATERSVIEDTFLLEEQRNRIYKNILLVLLLIQDFVPRQTPFIVNHSLISKSFL